MVNSNKDQQAILDKLGIKALNPMQVAAVTAIRENTNTVLLSPTGTGKTLAFLLPILETLDPSIQEIQAIIIVPSRELALQIEQVSREMGSGYKINAVYGGRAGTKDKIDLQTPPSILIGTPGRIADHIRRDNIQVDFIKTLVLDEFDKSLEIGYEAEIKEISTALRFLNKRVLTSATQKTKVPAFMRINEPKTLNYLTDKKTNLSLKTLVSPSVDKLDVLNKLLGNLGNKNGIIFCNFKDSINNVSEFLTKKNRPHACFFGGMEQLDREHALIKFRNGTHNLLIATDLAARGIDVPELDFIIHFELPQRADEFTHRNGRTARMNTNGTAYIIKWGNEELPSFIKGSSNLELTDVSKKAENLWETLYVTGGRKEKVSKGDIAGLFFKQGNLEKHELGTIELKQECAYVAVPSNKAKALVSALNNSRIKKIKVRISIVQ